MSTFSLQERVKALNLGLTISGDFNTGLVTVTGGRQTFTFEGRDQAGQALDLANYVCFNTLHKMSVGDGPIASLLAKLPRHAGSCSNQNVLDPLGAYVGVEACGCSSAPNAPRPHTPECYVYRNARALIGVDHRHLCDCGAEHYNAKKTAGGT